MKTKVVDKKGNKIEDIELSKNVFGLEPNDVLLSQYVRVYLFNQRQGNSSTKDRGEVSGSGRKPWKQKGTGNARAGSKRSPLWRHGGVVHGPKPKSWRLGFPKRMRKMALLMALSHKQGQEKMLVIDELKFKNPSAREASEIVQNLKISDRSVVVLDENDQNVIRSFNNIKGVKTEFWGNLNTFSVLNCKNILFTKASISKLQEKYESK